MLAETGGLGEGRVDMKEDARVLEEEAFKGLSITCFHSLKREIYRESGSEGCGDCTVGCRNYER